MSCAEDCPQGRRFGLIRDPDLAIRIVEAVAAAGRAVTEDALGWCGSDADPVHWCQQLEQAGAQLLTLHGRTRGRASRALRTGTPLSKSVSPSQSP